MKSVGKVLLLIAGIFFIIWGVYGIIGSVQAMTQINADTSMNTVASLILGLVFAICELFAGIGAVCFFTGKGPFVHWVGPTAIIILVIAIVNLVLAICNGNFFSTSWWLPTFGTVISVCYCLGYFMCKNS